LRAVIHAKVGHYGCQLWCAGHALGLSGFRKRKRKGEGGRGIQGTWLLLHPLSYCCPVLVVVYHLFCLVPHHCLSRSRMFLSPSPSLSLASRTLVSCSTLKLVHTCHVRTHRKLCCHMKSDVVQHWICCPCCHLGLHQFQQICTISEHTILISRIYHGITSYSQTLCNTF